MNTLVAIRSSLLLSSTVSDPSLTNKLVLENLTSEQYSGVLPRQINALSVSKDTLNPMLNTKILKQRLDAIEYYNTLHGLKYARWPHFWMKQTGNYLWKYKGNLAVKGFFAYMVYREVQNYRNLHQKTVMTFNQSFSCFGAIGMTGGAFAAVCALI